MASNTVQHSGFFYFSVVLANLGLKSNLGNFISNCHPKMVGTNHVSVEDVQIDKTRHVFSNKKIIKLSSFNHSFQIKPKNFPEPKTLACQIYDFKEMSEILRG